MKTLLTILGAGVFGIWLLIGTSILTLVFQPALATPTDMINAIWFVGVWVTFLLLMLFKEIRKAF